MQLPRLQVRKPVTRDSCLFSDAYFDGFSQVTEVVYVVV